MKIIDKELTIDKIIAIYEGNIPPTKVTVKSRKCDAFAYILSGSAKYTFKNNEYIAETGNIIYLAKDSNYSIDVTDNNYTFYVLDFEFLNVKCDNQIFKSKNLVFDESIFIDIKKTFFNGSFYDKINCKSLLYKIYSDIVKSETYVLLSKNTKQKMEEIITYIQQNISNENLSINDLAKKANFSEGHFRRVFKNIYNIPPIDYILNLKINMSKKLLLTTSLKIEDISKECGFHDVYYFDRIFKKKVKSTPCQYRKYNVLT